MKKTAYLFIACLLCINHLNAQSSSFGISAGAVFSSYKATFESVSITAKTKTGFTLGVLTSIGMGKNFSLQPALNFVKKGGTIKDGGFTDKTTLNYLELPVNFVFNTKAGTGSFFAGAGPCFSMGLSGKEKYEYDDDDGPETIDIKFGSGDEDDFKPFEMGVNILAGYRLKSGLFFSANYNAALNNILNVDGADAKYHNRYFSIKVGCMFGNKKK